jgi:hypothetical protein
MQRGVWFALLLICVLGLPGCITRAALDAEEPRHVEANKALAEKDWPRARIALKAYIDARAFSHLSTNDQFGALRAGASVELYHGDKAVGYGYLLRAVLLPQAGQKEWSELTTAANYLKHDADSVRGLIKLAQSWPDNAAALDERVVIDAVHAVKSLGHDAQLEAYWALYTARFKFKWDIEPSAAWRDLVLLLLEKDRLTDAVAVAARINSAEVLMGMRADRRFDAVVAANPAHFDIEAAAHEELRAVQESSDTYPQILELKIAVVMALRQLHDYGAMLAAADELMSEVESTNFPQKLFKDSDYDDEYRWLLNVRAIALDRLGQTEQAVAQMQAASRLTEEGAKNVSQAINLGFLFCRLNRPNDALAAIVEVGPVSSLGGVEVEIVRLEAAVQLKDVSQVDKSMRFLQAHRADAPADFERALVLTGQWDLAAQDLIGQLLDPAKRQDALKTVQDYAPIPEPAWEQEFDQKWRTLIARNDVQAAIAKVGRADTYRLDLFD